MERGPFSKIIEFLRVQIAQLAVITISLKIWFPNCSLAFNIMSRGGKLRFQLIEMDPQQD